MLWMLLAASAPTYLTCSITRGDGTPMVVDLSVDETNQRVGISYPSTGHSEDRRGVFSPTEIRAKGTMDEWTISRTDLGASRAINGSEASRERGKCEVKPVPAKRAF